jgi:hypothetical protein
MRRRYFELAFFSEEFFIKISFVSVLAKLRNLHLSLKISIDDLKTSEILSVISKNSSFQNTNYSKNENTGKISISHEYFKFDPRSELSNVFDRFLRLDQCRTKNVILSDQKFQLVGLKKKHFE